MTRALEPSADPRTRSRAPRHRDRSRAASRDSGCLPRRAPAGRRTETGRGSMGRSWEMLEAKPQDRSPDGEFCLVFLVLQVAHEEPAAGMTKTEIVYG